MKKYITVEPKVGDYFKAEIDGYRVTGRIGEGTDIWDKDKKDLVLLFDNEEIDEGWCPDDRFGFENTYPLDSIKEIEIITKKEHENLLLSPLYGDFWDYKVRVKKGEKPEDDLFEFGCGAIEVSRQEINDLLSLFKVIKPTKLEDLYDLMRNIDNETGSLIAEVDIPKIKQLLSAV